MAEDDLREEFLDVPPAPPLTVGETITKALLGMTLSPVCLLLGRLYGVPGLGFRWAAIDVCARSLWKRPRLLPPRTLVRYLFWPMDSTRYFEFEFAWSCLQEARGASSYLDVSSPRLFPVVALLRRKGWVAVLINPQGEDLGQTASLVRAVGLDARCTLYDIPIEEGLQRHGPFDLITSLSVIEHIPDDRSAVRNMWNALKSGGRLILTVPCAAQAVIQYMDRNPYGLLEPGEDGYVFFQRLYDRRLLARNVFEVTGAPRTVTVYGEKRPGVMAQNSRWRRSDRTYPAWMEPYWLGRNFTYFADVDQLPGEGVIGMEFAKP